MAGEGGLLLSEWQETTIGSFAPFNYGKGLPEDQRRAGDVPVFGSGGVIGFHREALTSGPAVIIGRKGAAGAVHYSPGPCWPIDTTFYVVDEDPLVLRFKYYLLKDLEPGQMNTDSAVPGLNRQAVHARKVRVPPLPEQRAIAHILGVLDDKIELNRRMGETLERMARVLFRAWFLDFEPVRAKMEGRWRRGQSLPGLPAHLYDLFPDHLVDSELGKIPEGWEVRMLGDVVNLVKGRSYSSNELKASRVALVTLKSFSRGGGYRVDGLKPFVGEYKVEQVVHPGEVIIALTDVTQAAEVIGRPAIVRASPDYDILVASLDVGIIRPKHGELSTPFLYFLLSTQNFTYHVLSYVNGTTVLHLDREGILSYRFAFPPPSVVQAYANVTVPLFAKIDTNYAESRTLAALRDALLPKLIRGEIRVKDAERSLEERGL